MNVITREKMPDASLPPGRPRPSRRRKLVFLLVVVLCAAGLAALYYRTHDAAELERQRREFGRAVPVVVAPVVVRDVPIYLDGLGTVQAFYTVTVHSMIDGPLQQVAFKEGQDLHVGDVLARIDPRPYQAALDQAVAKKAQDDASLANARVDLARYTKLAATAYTSAQTADTQKATVAQDEALVKQDQAQIDTARTNLSYTVIASPIDGRAGIRQVDAGNIIHASDTTGLVVITTLRPISVLFTLPQQALPLVTRAMAAQSTPLTAVALPQGDLTGADPASPTGAGLAVLDAGKLEVVDNQVDSTTGTIKLKATFPNRQLSLWPGGFVNVRLLVQTVPQAVTVPPVAVQHGPRGTFVYVVNADDTATRRSITVGHEDVETSIVTDGLKPGERVVTDGSSRLTDGARVTVNDGTRTPAEDPSERRPGRPRRNGEQTGERRRPQTTN